MNYFQQIISESKAAPEYSRLSVGNFRSPSGLRVGDTISPLPEGKFGTSNYKELSLEAYNGQPAQSLNETTGSAGPWFDPVGEPFDMPAADTDTMASDGRQVPPRQVGEDAERVASAEIHAEVNHRGTVLRSAYVGSMQSKGNPEITEMLAQKSEEESEIKGLGWQQPVLADSAPSEDGEGEVSSGADPNSLSFNNGFKDGFKDEVPDIINQQNANITDNQNHKTGIEKPSNKASYNQSLEFEPLENSGKSSSGFDIRSNPDAGKSTQNKFDQKAFSPDADNHAQVSQTKDFEPIQVDHASRMVPISQTLQEDQTLQEEHLSETKTGDSRFLDFSEKTSMPGKDGSLPDRSPNENVSEKSNTMIPEDKGEQASAVLKKTSALVRPVLNNENESQHQTRTMSPGSANSTNPFMQDKSSNADKQSISPVSMDKVLVPKNETNNTLKTLSFGRPSMKPRFKNTNDRHQEPLISIGRIDVIVEAPKPAAVAPAQKSIATDKTSQMYLRRL